MHFKIELNFKIKMCGPARSYVMEAEPQDCPYDLTLITFIVCMCLSTGELVCKRPAEPLDGAPFVAGTVTLLKQFHSENTEQFFALLSQYVRSMIASTQG